MEDSNSGTGFKLSEEELVSLLASLKEDPSPEADFEARFLHDFHERVAREAVTRPARKLFWEHLLLRLTNFGKLKTVFGASSLCLGALAVGFVTWNADETETSAVRVENNRRAAEANAEAFATKNSIFLTPINQQKDLTPTIDVGSSYTLPSNKPGYAAAGEYPAFSTMP